MGGTALTLNIEFSRTLSGARDVLDSACDESTVFWESLFDGQDGGCWIHLNLPMK